MKGKGGREGLREAEVSMTRRLLNGHMTAAKLTLARGGERSLEIFGLLEGKGRSVMGM